MLSISKDVIITFADKLDLWQTEYFSLSAVAADNSGTKDIELKSFK